MTETLLLRAACVHGRYENHPNVKYEKRDGMMRPVNDDYSKRCPGGRDITIDYDTPDNLRDDERIGWQAAMEHIAAAIGVTG